MIVKEEENKREDKRPLLGQAPLTIHFCFLRSLEEKKKINTYTETHVKPRKKNKKKQRKKKPRRCCSMESCWLFLAGTILFSTTLCS